MSTTPHQNSNRTFPLEGLGKSEQMCITVIIMDLAYIRVRWWQIDLSRVMTPSDGSNIARRQAANTE